VRKAGRLAEAPKLTFDNLASAELKENKVVSQVDGHAGRKKNGTAKPILESG